MVYYHPETEPAQSTQVPLLHHQRYSCPQKEMVEVETEVQLTLQVVTDTTLINLLLI